MKYCVCTKEVISITQNEERAHKTNTLNHTVLLCIYAREFVSFLSLSLSLSRALFPNEMI